MGDKKLNWEFVNLVHGADLNYDHDTIDIAENTYAPNMTLDSVSGFIDMAAGTNTQLYYALIGVTDGSGAYPFDGTTLGAITDDASLRNFLEKNRDSIWMSLGGICAAGGAYEEVKRIEFDAKSKRSLSKGQKLVFVMLGRNMAVSTASYLNYSVDLTSFYH